MSAAPPTKLPAVRRPGSGLQLPRSPRHRRGHEEVRRNPRTAFLVLARAGSQMRTATSTFSLAGSGPAAGDTPTKALAVDGVGVLSKSVPRCGRLDETAKMKSGRLREATPGDAGTSSSARAPAQGGGTTPSSSRPPRRATGVGRVEPTILFPEP